mgnify:FL=1|jgi:hypothetical protein
MHTNNHQIVDYDILLPVEFETVLKAFRQVKKIQEGTIKTRNVNELLSEYEC